MANDKSDRLYLIEISEDGEVALRLVQPSDLSECDQKWSSEHEVASGHYDLADGHHRLILIRGRIVVPRAVEYVSKYEVD